MEEMNLPDVIIGGAFGIVLIVLYRCLLTALKIEKELKKLEATLNKWKEEDGE